MMQKIHFHHDLTSDKEILHKINFWGVGGGCSLTRHHIIKDK